ncbi:MAG TPA: bifunctional phosphopantothenoylcysteine decarboxylase/phosphopantothenate--cysteine ligase CoaBC, partial [Candidatus Eisenbacteria bacterium]|nr:bifunctional phosphopantothenoylcysteine decarboxylase/phosphopantothenate--cysteine ligase CoaBC [Candidatus Eisenbacteria bacterium]
AGPSREPLDPLRYLSNRSSGKMGYALARAALRRGAAVTLVSGPTALEPPEGVRLVQVTTAAEMRDAVLTAYEECTAVVMAAAVADYRIAGSSKRKIKRTSDPIEIRLEPNPDILKELGGRKDGKVLIGFAAETDDLIANAKKKLQEKNLDMIVANDVTLEGSGFEVDANAATIIDRYDQVESLPLMSKDELSDRIYDHFLALKRRA